MKDRLLSREEFLRSGFRRISGLIGLVTEEGRMPAQEGVLIRPPGAVEEGAFLNLCNKCGLCADACPRKAITLVDAEGEASFNTPVVEPGDEPCDFCLKCVDICKTGALLSPENKSGLKLGIAVIDRKSCLSWEKKIICGLCKYRCPQDAVLFKDGRLPAIDSLKCNGCGLCRHICPTIPKSVEIV